MIEGYPIKTLAGQVLFRVSGLISLSPRGSSFQRHPPITQVYFLDTKKLSRHGMDAEKPIWETVAIKEKEGVMSFSGNDVHMYISCWEHAEHASIAVIAPAGSSTPPTEKTLLDVESTTLLRDMLEQLRNTNAYMQSSK